MCVCASCVWVSCVWGGDGSGRRRRSGRRRTGCRTKNKNPTQRCGEQKSHTKIHDRPIHEYHRHTINDLREENSPSIEREFFTPTDRINIAWAAAPGLNHNVGHIPELRWFQKIWQKTKMWTDLSSHLLACMNIFGRVLLDQILCVASLGMNDPFFQHVPMKFFPMWLHPRFGLAVPGQAYISSIKNSMFNWVSHSSYVDYRKLTNYITTNWLSKVSPFPSVDLSGNRMSPQKPLFETLFCLSTLL